MQYQTLAILQMFHHHYRHHHAVVVTVAVTIIVFLAMKQIKMVSMINRLDVIIQWIN